MLYKVTLVAVASVPVSKIQKKNHSITFTDNLMNEWNWIVKKIYTNNKQMN